MPRALAHRRTQYGAVRGGDRCVQCLSSPASIATRWVDAGRHGRASARRDRADARGSPVDHAPTQAPPPDHGRRTRGGRGGGRAGARAGYRPSPAASGTPRCIRGRARVRTSGPLQRRDRRRARRSSRRPIRPRSGRRSPRARPHSEPRRRDHRTSRLPSGTRSCSSRCCLSSSTFWTTRTRFANVSGGSPFSLSLVYLDTERSVEITRGLRRPPCFVPDGPPARLRRVLAGTARGPEGSSEPDPRASTPILAGRLTAIDDTRPLFPLGAIVAFAAGLTATIAYEAS